MKRKRIALLLIGLGIVSVASASETILAKLSTTTWTNQPVTVQIENFDQYETMQYQITNGEWNKLDNNKFQVKQSTQVRLKGQRKETGSEEEQTITVDNIDTELPDLTFTPEEQINYQIVQEVTMHPEDTGGSGVKSYRYRISHDNGKTYGNFETVMGEQATTITLDQDGINEIHAVVEDNAGNIKNVYSGVYYIRTAKPDAPRIVCKTPDWTNQTVKLGIEVADDVTHIEYKVNDGMWTTLTSNTIIVNNNATLTVRAMNQTMQYSEETAITITNIDKEPPTVTFQEDGSEENQKQITILPVDNQSGVKNYRYRIHLETQTVDPVWNVVPDSQPTTIVLTENATIEVEVTDQTGNQQTISSDPYEVVKEVVEPPVIRLSHDNWSGTGIYIIVKVPATVDHVEWRTEKGKWTIFTGNGFYVHENGMVYARSVRNKGTYSEVVSLEVTKNDKGIPGGSFDVMEAKGVDHVTTTFTPTDDLSGVKNMFYCISKSDQPCGNEWVTPEWINLQSANPHTFELTEPGIQRICVRVHDFALNYQRICSGIFELTAPPKEPQIILSTTDWTNQSILATLQVDDNQSNQLYYRLNEMEWEPYSKPFEIKDNTVLHVKNQSPDGQITEASQTITNIDKVKPTGYFEVRDRNEAKTFLTRFDAADFESGVKQVRYQVSIDNGVNFSDWIVSEDPNRFEVILNQEGQNKLRVEVTDLAGNQEIIYSETLNITTKPPQEPEIVIDPNSTNQKQIIQVISNKELTRLEYKLGTGQWLPLPSKQIEIYQNTTVYIRGYNHQNQVSKTNKVEIDSFEEPVIDIAGLNRFFGITPSTSYS